MNDQLSKMIEDFIRKRADAKLEKIKKARAKSGSCDELDADARSAAEMFEPATWLDRACERAKQISLATHAPKFTHPWADGSSIYLQESNASGSMSRYLGTADIVDRDVDVVGNAAALDVAQLLQLEVNGYRLIDAISRGDSGPLAPFSSTPEQLACWMQGFKEALVSKDLSTHKLSKQIYFPVGPDNYHILSPLFASSLAHALYKRVTASRFSEEAKAARKAKKEEKIYPNHVVEFPNTAIQSFGGTKPQNVSQLNSGRGGKTYLLSCRPPHWKSYLRPPTGRSDGFWREFERRGAREIGKKLKDYLLEVRDKSSTFEIRSRRIELVDELITQLLVYAAELQQLVDLAGWSSKSKLSIAEQLWLDPWRPDPEFQLQRQTTEWQTEISRLFASWLNKTLSDDKLMMGDSEHKEWKMACEDRISRLKEDLEILSK